jgi:hypothetical protein
MSLEQQKRAISQQFNARIAQSQPNLIEDQDSQHGGASDTHPSFL